MLTQHMRHLIRQDAATLRGEIAAYERVANEHRGCSDVRNLDAALVRKRHELAKAEALLARQTPQVSAPGSAVSRYHPLVRTDS
jgi:hypothetical protein